MIMSCDPAGLVQVSKQPKCPKVGRALKVIWVFGPRVPKESLALCKPCFAPVEAA